MNKIDLKDKRILSALDEDGRESLSGIASKAGLSKQVVDYRIKNLVKRGIISKFSVSCDLTKLGYSTFGVYLRLRNLTEKKEQEIIEMIKNHPFTKWVVVCEGKWDVAFSMAARNIVDFNSKLEEVLEKIASNLDSYDTNIIFSIDNFYQDFIGKKDSYKTRIPRPEFSADKGTVKIDALDIKILQELEKDGRSSLVEISQKLNSSPDVVRYRIKNLTARKVIQEFKSKVNFKALGYNWYQLIIDLKKFPEAQAKTFIEKVKQIPDLSYVVRCIGRWDFELHIHSESNEAFRRILMKVRDELAEYIISYDTLIIFEKYKSTTFPEGVAEELLKQAKE
jgi:DNA-binding Lrp family transcriptional regulator